MSISNSGLSAPRATDNPWLPIDTMPLSTVGTEVDIKDNRRLYSGVLVSGINLERGIVYERNYVKQEDTFYPGRIDDFTITHTTGTIRATLNAEWRPHV